MSISPIGGTPPQVLTSNQQVDEEESKVSEEENVGYESDQEEIESQQGVENETTPTLSQNNENLKLQLAIAKEKTKTAKANAEAAKQKLILAQTKNSIQVERQPSTTSTNEVSETLITIDEEDNPDNPLENFNFWQTVKKDLKEYFLEPIVVNQKTGKIVVNPKTNKPVYKVTKYPGKAFLYSIALKIIGWFLASFSAFIGYAMFWGSFLLIDRVAVFLDSEEYVISAHKKCTTSFKDFLNFCWRQLPFTTPAKK